MSKKKQFFYEILDNPKYERFTVYALGVTIAFILLWVYTAIPSQEHNALIYIIMSIIWGFGLAFDLVWEKLKFPDQMAANGLGAKPIKALLIGIGIGLLIWVLGGTQSIVQPFSLVVDSSWLTFLFVVVAAPFVEANFFRGLIQPVFTLVLHDWVVKDWNIAGVIAMVAQCAGFAFFHVNVISGGGGLEVFLPYFIFGVGATVLVYATRSVAAEYGWHFVNNFVAVVVR
jgi:membrane protease YdiL (CAAX protease family)